MQTTNYNKWIEPVKENDYRNVEALAEVTLDLTARLEVLIEGYHQDYSSKEQIQKTMELGRRALEAEERFRTNSDNSYMNSLAEEIDVEESREYVDLGETIGTDEGKPGSENIEKFLIQNSFSAERKLEDAQKRYKQQLDRVEDEVGIDISNI